MAVEGRDRGFSNDGQREVARVVGTQTSEQRFHRFQQRTHSDRCKSLPGKIIDGQRKVLGRENLGSMGGPESIRSLGQDEIGGKGLDRRIGQQSRGFVVSRTRQ